MSTYEIIPETTIAGYDLVLDATTSNAIKTMTEDDCRRLCDQRSSCEAFSYTPAFTGKCGGILVNYQGGICNIKSSNQVPMQYATGTTLYLKRGRKSYTLLWIFLAILGIIIFVLMARKKSA